MSSAKTERLLNLVICLLSTRRPLSKAQIRSAVPQYGESTSMEAFERMFERDKDELRDLGIPLTTAHADALFDDEVGYRIDRDAYALPEVSFEPDEMTVLGLASRVWQQASLAGPAARALTKLKAAGVEPDDASLIGLEPRVRTSEPAFEPLWAAVRDRRARALPLPPVRLGRVDRAARRAVGRRQLARPLVPHRPRPRPRRRPGLPALPDHRRRRARRQARRVRRARGSRRPRDAALARAGAAAEQGRRPGPGAAAGRPCAAGRWSSPTPRTAASGWTRLVVPFYDVEVAGRGAHVVRAGGRGRGAARAARRHRAPARGPSSPGRRRMSEGATERLSRLLTMVPWLLTHQGVELAEAATEFGVDEAQIVKDLELLFVCGTPGHLPDDLIEAEWEGGRVFVDNADSIARPLRLGVDEALALVVGLRTLAEVPGLGERAAVDRALAKLEAAAGAAAAGAGQRARRRSRRAPRPRCWPLPATRAGRAPAAAAGLPRAEPRRDDPARRRPDAGPDRRGALVPRGLVPPGRGRAAVPARPDRRHRGARRGRHAAGRRPGRATWTSSSSRPGRTTCWSRSRSSPTARWIVDYYPVDSVEELAGGRLLVRLRTADTRWLQRLVLRLSGQARVLEPAELGDHGHPDSPGTPSPGYSPDPRLTRDPVSSSPTALSSFSARLPNLFAQAREAGTSPSGRRAET